MRAWRTLSTALWVALSLTGCGPGEVQSQEVATSESEIPIDMEGMEDWSYLLAHTTPFESATEWDGDVNGFKTEWHANGAKSGEGEYRDSKRVGEWTFWHENGQKRWEGTYVADAPAGLERAWYKDGKPSYEGAYENGARHGAFSYWYPSGQLWWRGSFNRGKRDGAFMQWRADGSVDAHESGIYERGVKTADLNLDDHQTLALDGAPQESVVPGDGEEPE